VVLVEAVLAAQEQLDQTPMAAAEAVLDFSQLEEMLLVLTEELVAKVAAVAVVLVVTEQLLEMVELEVMV
jgi:hypothetical protein